MRVTIQVWQESNRKEREERKELGKSVSFAIFTSFAVKNEAIPVWLQMRNNLCEC